MPPRGTLTFPKLTAAQPPFGLSLVVHINFKSLLHLLCRPLPVVEPEHAGWKSKDHLIATRFTAMADYSMWW